MAIDLLMIVESPNKVSKISHILSEIFPDKKIKVVASAGHISEIALNTGDRDLGIDLNNMKPIFSYKIDKKQIIDNIVNSSRISEEIIIASDPDREGEGIAWHLNQLLISSKIKSKINRCTFNEISKEAVEQALNNKREINVNLVNAQQTRQMIDRMIGFELSKFIMNQDSRLRSAGRVQSVALKMITERYYEKVNHKQNEYWTISSEFEGSIIKYLENGKSEEDDCDDLTDEENNNSHKIISEEDAEKLINSFQEKISVLDTKSINSERVLYEPFTTSDVLQAANKNLVYLRNKQLLHCNIFLKMV